MVPEGARGAAGRLGGIHVLGRVQLQKRSSRPAHQSPLPPLQAWVYWSLGQRQLCIAFRGTEQDNWRDYLTDISLAPALLDPEAVPSLPLHKGVCRGCGAGSGGLYRELCRMMS